MRRTIYRTIRCRLMARASTLALRVALRPGDWASGLLAAGLIGIPALALAQETIDLATNAELTIQGAATGDNSGRSVSDAGDVNGDGIDDLLIGAPNADPNGRSNAGASYVVFGTDQGFPATIDLATDADLIIEGAAPYDFSGRSVSGAGDVNGDGIDDLLIGAPYADPNGHPDAGTSYVVFGAVDLADTIDLADPVSGVDLVIQGAAGTGFSGGAGYVSGAGDVNDDGIDDLIVGAPGLEGGGASYVVFGAEDLAGTIDLADSDGADLIILGAAAYDFSGYSVSGAGDLNGDGIDDLLIGAWGVGDYAGASYVVFGATDLAGTIDLVDPVDGADLVILGAAAHDATGRSVSGPGDVNGDGIDDLLIGAPNASRDGRDYSGLSYVLFGAENLAGTIDLADPANGADLIIQGAEFFNFLGDSVSGAGDFNRDGIDDLIVSAPGVNISYVVFGSMDLAGTIDLADPMNAVGLINFGGAFVSGAGDVNGDGIDDLILGAPAADPNGRDYAGASYVVFGGAAAAVERLIAEVEAAGLLGGLENGLTAKLETALKGVSKRKLTVAMLGLRAFVRQVEAQRGKKIDEANADDWIAAASSIIDTLNTLREQDRAPHRRTASALAKAP